MQKYQIDLTYEKYQIDFKFKVEMSKSTRDIQYYIENSDDHRHCISQDGVHKFIQMSDRPPEKERYFYTETIFTARQRNLGSLMAAFNCSFDLGKIGRIRHTSTHSVFGLEIKKDHIFGDRKFKSYDIVIFKASY